MRASMGDALGMLVSQVRGGDVVITFSAGDGNLVGERLLEMLNGNGRTVTLLKERAKRNEPLAKHTTARIGGPADLLIEARTSR